jgi:hypothetical protein
MMDTGASIMTTRTVRATRASDGHIQLLEPVDLPGGVVFTVVLEVADVATNEQQPLTLPVRRLGRTRAALTRDEIYDGLV